MSISIKNNKLTAMIAAFTLLFSSLVFALDLDEAKQRGLVGEQVNGYLGAVVNQADVEELIRDINAKRKAKYLELAAKNNITLEQVEKLAANKAYSKTEVGHFIQINGVWVKK